MTVERDRNTYIGASEAAAVVGLSRWGGPFSVWKRKVGLDMDDRAPALRMWLGQRLEPILLELYEARTGRKPRRHQRLVIAKGIPFMGAHPDYDRLEVKTARSAQGWGEDGTLVTEDDPSAIPLDYFLQVQHQLVCTGWDYSDIAVLIGHDEFRTYTVPRGPKVIERLVEAETEFWRNYVETGTPPPLDDSDAAKAYLREVFPREREPLRIASEAEVAMMTEVLIARGVAKAAEQAKEAAENRLKAAIGDSSGVTDNNLRATWTAYDRTDLDMEVLRAELQSIGRGDIIEHAARTKPVRTLRVTGRTED